MGSNPIQSRTTAPALGVHASFPRATEGDRVLDLVCELDSLRGQLAVQAESERELRRELAVARERWFEFYEMAPVAYLDVDAELRLLRTNITAAGLLGVERRRLASMTVNELFDAVSTDQLRIAVACVLEKDQTLTLRGLAISRRSLLVKATLTRAGEVVLVTLLEDRSDVRSSRSREAELQTVLDAIDSGIATVDEHGKICSCNRSMGVLFNRRPARLVGTPIVRLLPALSSTPKPGHYELSAEVGATRIPVEVSVTVASGAPGGFVVHVTDVSERKREQRERTEALLRFNQIAERISDAFYVAVASSGESLYVSPAFSQIYARPLVAHAHEPWPRLRWVHEADRPRVREAAEALWTGGSFDVEYRVVHPDGDVRTVHDRAFMLSDQRRVTGIVRDVTRERAMEEELQQVQRLEAMGTLASGVAHDFNNLLMGLGGCVQLALTRLEAEHPSHAYLRRASDAIVRGANLARQILRIGDTRRAPEGSVELDALVRAMQDVLQSILGDAVTLVVRCDAAGRHIAAEPADVEQILMNLGTNARDAMPKGGTLTLKTSVEHASVVLELVDTGVGMSPAVRARVFEPFFTTKAIGKGTGLGLATVFALVRRLGGTLKVDSELGRGTRFRLSFPGVAAAPEPRVPESVPPPAGGATVLMVDDDPLVRLTVENHLSALGYRVLVASNTEEAIEICEDAAVRVDVMVSDVMMPGMLGPELGKLLEQRDKKFPVLYMSAHPQEELVRNGHIANGARLLSKPFDAPTLSEALMATLEEHRLARENARLRIFVIDDNRDIAEGLQEILQLEGHTVEIAVTPEEALKRVPLFRPHVVLCDVALGGGMDGFELTRLLRHDPRVANAPFIALTGFQSSECREQAEQAGMRQVLTKPLVTSKLLRVLKEL